MPRLVVRTAAGLLFLTIGLLGLWSTTASAAGAVEHPPIELDAIDPVPVPTWGVSDQDPFTTQTETLDVLVWDMVQSGDYLFVGGAFLNVRQDRDSEAFDQKYVAAFDIHTGQWVDTWRPTLDRAVYALDVLPNGSLLVGGEFEEVNGTVRRGVVALDPITGEIDPGFEGAVDRPWSNRRATVRAMKVEAESGRIYVAGNFSHLDGPDGKREQVSKAARFTDAAGTPDRTWKPQVKGGAVWGLDTDVSRGHVALAGFFTSIDGEPATGHFDVVDDAIGKPIPGQIRHQHNTPGAQPEQFDVVFGDDIVFMIGEQHTMQVFDSDSHAQLGYHHTGITNNGFMVAGTFAGGAYQAGDRVGDIVFAGCHCTSGSNNHFESFTGRRTTLHNVMAYDAITGRHIPSFDPDIESPRDGHWTAATDTNGCLYLGGDYHLGGNKSGRSRWLGGFAKFCPPKPTIEITDIGDQVSTVGDDISIQVDATSPAAANGDDVVLIFEAADLPSGLTLDRDTGLITGSPTTSGTWTPTVTVSAVDERASRSWTSFEWVVVGVNPPTINPIADITSVESDSFDYQVQVRGGGLAFSATGLPDGLTIDTQTGLISGTLATDGLFSVEVTIVDRLGRTDTETYRHRVLNWERYPAVTVSGNPVRYRGNFFVGWFFDVDETMSLTELGILDGNKNGTIENAGSTSVALYDRTTRELLVSAEVPADAPVEDGAAYVTLDSPFTLEPGRTYVIAAEYSGETHTYYGTNTFHPGINHRGWAYKSGSSLGYPFAQAAVADAYFGGTFRVGSSRPDPDAAGPIDPGGDPDDGGDPGGAGQITLVQPGAEWSYDDTGTDQGTAWPEPAFDDAGWALGRAEFGFGDGDEVTPWATGSVTYYARNTFEFNGTIPSSLELDLKADDGAVVYLNGTEILRDNMPEGTITAQTKPTTWRSGTDEDFKAHITAADALVQGTNVVAVEIHNIWSGNSDLSFDLQLRTSDAEAPEPPPAPTPDPIEPGSEWSFVSSTNGQPADWPLSLPADAQVGQAEFGFGDADETTLLEAGHDAYYFARQFEIESTEDFPTLTMGLAADDGAVVYINGTEVQRVNMPEGPVEPTTRPLTWMAGPDERFKTYQLDSAPLIEGTNTITVEVHNLWPGNSDVSFDLYLR